MSTKYLCRIKINSVSYQIPDKRFAFSGILTNACGKPQALVSIKEIAQMTNTKAKFNLEKALTELDKLVEQMESGQPSIEESLKLFEKGVMLTKSCQKALAEAELKVQQLSGDKDRSED